jgi:hypothetical protein
MEVLFRISPVLPSTMFKVLPALLPLRPFSREIANTSPPGNHEKLSQCNS